MNGESRQHLNKLAKSYKNKQPNQQRKSALKGYNILKAEASIFDQKQDDQQEDSEEELDENFMEQLNFSKFNNSNTAIPTKFNITQKLQIEQTLYANLNKEKKKAKESISQQISRKQSNQELDQIDLVDYQNTEQKQKAKKKIFRKIIKKKVNNEQQQENNKIEQSQTISETKQVGYEQQSKEQQDTSQPKQKVKKIIIKKKKKQNQNLDQQIDEDKQIQPTSNNVVSENKKQNIEQSQEGINDNQEQNQQKPKVKKIIKIVKKSKKTLLNQNNDQQINQEISIVKQNVENTQLQQENTNKCDQQKEKELKRAKSVMTKQSKQSSIQITKEQLQQDKQQLKKKIAQSQIQITESSPSQSDQQEGQIEERNDASVSSDDLSQNQQKLIQSQQILNKNSVLSFIIAKCDTQAYNAFIHQLVFGQFCKELIMSPIPINIGQLRFTIERNKNGLNKLHPSYYLYLEKNQGGRILMLYAKKRAFNKTSNYLISLEKNKKERESDQCVGKLRASSEGDKFTLYDNGENYKKLNQVTLDKIRNEHGVFMYRYEPCNVGNIRKMLVILPSLIETGETIITQDGQSLGYNQDFKTAIMKQKAWKSIRDQDSIMEVFAKEGVRNNNYQVYVDNPPAWNPKTNTYVYDFKGRVTEPSIKNFQLIPEIDGRRQITLQDFVLQFGKNGKDSFIMDVQYPFSVFQAFGLALSAFDTD